MSIKRIEMPSEKCPKCGRVYEVTKVDLPVKDRDSALCKCGQVLREWKETAHYEYSPIS